MRWLQSYDAYHTFKWCVSPWFMNTMKQITKLKNILQNKSLCGEVITLVSLAVCGEAISYGPVWLPHWGWVTHICVSKLTIIGSDNGLSPGRRQAIFWTNPGMLLIGPLGTNFSEILIEIYTFSFKKMHLKMSSGKWRPFCLGLNVLNHIVSSITRTTHLVPYQIIAFHFEIGCPNSLHKLSIYLSKGL